MIGQVGPMLQIDRSTPFDPTTLMGLGWEVKKEDERSLALTQIDPTQVCFPITFRLGELTLSHQENLGRLEASPHILLDAKVCQEFYQNQHLIPKCWEKYGCIHFYGTILVNSHSNQEHILSLAKIGQSWACLRTWKLMHFYDDDGSACFLD